LQSLWLENQALSLRDIPIPDKPGEALIRIRLSGICGTDLEMLRGYLVEVMPRLKKFEEVDRIVRSDGYLQ